MLLLAQYKQFEWECDCTQHEQLQIDKIVMESQALRQIAPYLLAKGARHVLLVADARTSKAAGEAVEQLLNDANISCTLCMLEDEANGDVIANEQAICQVFVAYEASVDMLLAVGAGTIHDIVRFVSDKVDIPFISVPTAASVDGFTSAGAPLVIRGFKQTFQTCSPQAIFADSDVLVQAPRELLAAGFADMLAKYTSLFDWQVSHLLADEPYCPQIAELTRESLRQCVKHVDDIAAGNIAGVEVLMQALFDSGIAMLFAGHSRPASGAEHHLSHYWEMDFLKHGKRQILHGAKVGVSTIIITKLYTTQLRDVLSALQHSGDDHWTYGQQIKERLHQHGSTLESLLAELPEPQQLHAWLQRVNAPTTPQQLGIDDALVEQSLHEAIHLRDRYTGLKLLNEFGQLRRDGEYE